jgi:hypothetical protein
MRTSGWWTVEPSDVAAIIEKYGRLVVGEKGELMVEVIEESTLQDLSTALSEHFGDQVLLSP